MEDLKAVARVVRLMTPSMIVNLSHVPADKLDWKPNPASKSALEVVGEVIGVMRMMQPVLRGEGFQQAPHPKPADLEDARRMLTEAAEEYAAGLEAAGAAELDRPLESPFGTMWAGYAVTFGMIDLVHHHGQITYLQSLLGDAENHFGGAESFRYLAPPR